MDIVQLFKALADETRIRILALLKHGELCSCDIEEILRIKQSNSSRHLNKLKLAGLIISNKNSQWVYYRINEDTLRKYPFLETLIKVELEKNTVCESDLDRLRKYKASGLTCEQLEKNP